MPGEVWSGASNPTPSVLVSPRQTNVTITSCELSVAGSISGVLFRATFLQNCSSAPLSPASSRFFNVAILGLLSISRKLPVPDVVAEAAAVCCASTPLLDVTLDIPMAARIKASGLRMKRTMQSDFHVGVFMN
jgi:hypothetical protein